VGYDYEPGGEIRFATDPNSKKMALVRTAGRVGFLVQTEQMPYRYVSVEGAITGIERTAPRSTAAGHCATSGPSAVGASSP
jgi:hypothetical protein